MTGRAARGALSVAVLVVCAEAPAWAATSLRTTASAPRAEVGQGVRIELSVLTDGDDDPNTPRLTLPPGFSVQGPNVASSRQISFTNGSFENRHGITATWVVAGSRPGRFQLGPASVKVGAALLQGETLDLEVVPQGTLPAAPPKRRGFFDPSDPMDPFSLFKRPPGLPDLSDVPLLDTLPEPPGELVVAKATDETAFLRATLEPERSVVGQQVTLRVYAYGSRGPFDEVGSSESSRPDFLSYPIVESSYRQRRYTVAIEDQHWQAVKIREIALFSLKPGSLAIGPMKMSFRGRGYPEGPPPGGLARESPALTALVTEPPIAGRPPGYEIGTVGSYTLSAEVEPRRIEAGGAVSVTVRVEGTGNVPRRVKVPEGPGMEWMEPSFSEAIMPNAGAIGGWRQLRYVVRIDTPGKVTLGEVSLPHFDASRGRYEVARAALGDVEVVPVATLPGAPSAAPSTSPPVDPFAALGPPRRTLSPLPPRGPFWSDQKPFWASLLGAPFLVLLAHVSRILGGRLRNHLSARRQESSVLAGRSLDDATRAAERGDAGAVAASIERALYLAIEDRLGLRARAILRDCLARDLAVAGASPELSANTVSLLDRCDALRFAGKPTEARELIDVARKVTSQFLSLSKRVSVAGGIR